MPSWTNNFVPINQYVRPGTKLKGVRKIVIHWTSNPGGTAAGHQLYFAEVLPMQNTEAVAQGRKPVYASAHFFVDPKEGICIIPLDEVAFYANENYMLVDGKPYRGVEELKSNANLLSISIEMCVEKNNRISDTTINRTVLIATELCSLFKLTENDIVRHFDVTRKPCPYPYVKERKLFDGFKRGVRNLLNKSIKYPGHVIKYGSKGYFVVPIQQLLGVTPDSQFGRETENAVKQFQMNNGLKVDGIVGEKTWNLLFKK